MRAINVLLAFLVSFLIAFGIFEAGLRIFPKYRPQESVNQFDSKLGWSKTPGKQVGRSTHEFSISFDINALGLRDDPMESTDKPDGVYRVVMLGDSFVLGYTVDRDELFVDHLEHWWQAEERKVEVLNAGTEGYSTDQEALWFQEHGVDFQPDLVLLFPYENDIFWAGQTDYYGKAKPRFRPDGTLETGTLADTSKAAPALSGLAIGQFLSKTVSPLLRGGAGKDPYSFEQHGKTLRSEFAPLLNQPPAFLATAVDHTRGALRALQKSCDQIGARLLMVPIPSESAIHPEAKETFANQGMAGLSDQHWSPDRPVDLFLSLGRELGIETYDVRPALKEAARKADTPLYFDDEWHFNGEGNRALAVALHGELESRGVFPASHQARTAANLTPPVNEGGVPTWLIVFGALWVFLGASFTMTYKDEKAPLAFVKVGALLAVVFTLIIGGSRLLDVLPASVATWILPGLLLILFGFILYKLGRRLSTIMELMRAFTLRGHWYLMPLVVVLLTIGSLLVVAASSPFMAPFIYTLF